MLQKMMILIEFVRNISQLKKRENKVGVKRAVTYFFVRSHNLGELMRKNMFSKKEALNGMDFFFSLRTGFLCVRITFLID